MPIMLDIAQPRITVSRKTPYDNGTSHGVLSPIEFVGRPAALISKPGVNLTGFHGVLSRGGLPPRSKMRAHVVPGKTEDRSEQVSQSTREIIASIEDPEVIEKILKHLGQDEVSQAINSSPPEGLFPHSTRVF